MSNGCRIPVLSLVPRLLLSTACTLASASFAQAPAPPIQPDPNRGFIVILRLYSPLEPFFDKSWRPSEIELVR